MTREEREKLRLLDDIDLKLCQADLCNSTAKYCIDGTYYCGRHVPRKKLAEIQQRRKEFRQFAIDAGWPLEDD